MRKPVYYFLLVYVFVLNAHASTLEVFATDVDAGGTDLRCKVFIPISGGPTWPAAVEVLGGQFENGTTGPDNVCQDLANNGYVVFSAETRRAPTHSDMSNAGPPGDPQQDPPSDGRPPQQTDDVQLAIRYARNPPMASAAFGKTNGKVVGVGGSSGATVISWWSINGTANDDKLDAFVGCSGLYDLNNSDQLGSSFRHVIENYINHTTDEGQTFVNAAKAASPYWITPASTPCPVLIFNSTTETIKLSVFTNMVTFYTTGGGTIESHQLSGNVHGFSYWNNASGAACGTVKNCSIDFLNRMVLGGSPTPPPVAPATILLQLK